MDYADFFGPGCCCDDGGKGCTIGITLDLYNFDGSKSFCTAPYQIIYKVSGTTKAGKAIALTGTQRVNSPTYRVSVGYSSAQLPEGSYTFSFAESTYVCGSYDDRGRFGTTSFGFAVKCPGQNAVLCKSTAAFDFQVLAADFALRSCTTTNGQAVQVAYSGPETACQTPTASGFGLSATVKVTGYPFSCSFALGGAGVAVGTTLDYTVTGCGSYTTNWGSAGVQPWGIGVGYPVSAASSCVAGSPGIPGANFNITGGVTATGQTGADGTGIATVSGGTIDKTQPNYNPPLATATVSRERFKDATVAESAIRNSSGGVAGFNCLPTARMTPADDYACINTCALPIRKTLHGSAFGRDFAMGWVAPDPGQAAYGVWIGFFTNSMPAMTCHDPNTGAYQIVTGDVSCYLSLNGNGFREKGNLSSSGLVCYYQSANDEPTVCSADPQRGPFSAFPVDGGYGGGGSHSQSCIPFVATSSGHGEISFQDGLDYAYDANYTVSE